LTEETLLSAAMEIEQSLQRLGERLARVLATLVRIESSVQQINDLMRKRREDWLHRRHDARPHLSHEVSESRKVGSGSHRVGDRSR